MEYELDLAAGMATFVWHYQGDANSSAMGSFRQYSDGHSVIDWGASTEQTDAAFTEIDASARSVLDVRFVTSGNWSYRAIKVPIEALDVDLLRATAGLP